MALCLNYLCIVLHPHLFPTVSFLSTLKVLVVACMLLWLLVVLTGEVTLSVAFPKQQIINHWDPQEEM